MKKLLAVLFVAILGLLMLAGPASATGNDDPPSADNKKVTLCHATSSETNPYTKIEVSVAAFYQAGHIDHDGDIWEAFSYTTKGGDVVNVPAQGDTSLLAFEDCVKPAEDTPVTKPDVTFQDLCGTENDVFAVSPGEGYTVAPVQHIAGVQKITVSLNEGFVWSDESTAPITFERPEFTNVDCDLPDTGGEASKAYGLGIVTLVAAAGIASMLLTSRRKNSPVDN